MANGYYRRKTDDGVAPFAIEYEAVWAQLGNDDLRSAWLVPVGRPDTKVLARCEPGAALLDYSIRYKNAGGVVARSELLPFANDLEAMDHGRAGSGHNAIVEVWKGEHLIVRLFGVDSRGPTTPGFK